MLNSVTKISGKFRPSVVVGLLLALCLPMLGQAAEFVGTQVCRQCHAAERSMWQTSDHFQAMRPATRDSVLAPFDQTLEAHGQRYQFLTQGDRFLADMPMQQGKGRETFEVRYTFGHRPLQQYLVEMAGGRLQALNTAWDARPEVDGGQRWFHLRDELRDDSPFHFSRPFQNWNSGCAACHSTRLQKGFDRTSNTYNTTFAETNVACESCHGPGSDHVVAAKRGDSPMALLHVPKPGQWTLAEGAAIAALASKPDSQWIDTCGGCHARRSQLAPLDPEGTFVSQFELSLIETPLYFPDGQIRDEVFVLGSFLQSKMYQQGVTCVDCHDPHSGRLRREGNALCSGCHSPGVYETASHLRHDKTSVGARCVNCHMPETVYMQVDARRDHHFGLPDPALTIALGVPNACNQCHRDKTPEWALQNIGKQPGVNQFAALQVALAARDPLVVPDAAAYIFDDGNPAIRRASLLANLPLTEDSLRTAVAELQGRDESLDATLLRAAAVSMISRAPDSLRQFMLLESLGDASLAVRLGATRALLDNVANPGSVGDAVLTALPAYRAALAVIEDQAPGQAALAELELALGNTSLAQEHFEQALSIEPHYLRARLNLADLHRSQGRQSEALGELARAVQLAPDSGAAQHSFGLALIRQGNKPAAMKHLAAATRQADQTPGFHYVYAVALDSVQQTKEAVAALMAASRVWPNQYDLLMLEVIYREKAGLLDRIQAPLEKLAVLAPQDPNVQRWLKKYRLR